MINVTVTTKTALEDIVRGIRAAERRAMSISDEDEREEVSSLIFALKREVGDFVKAHRGPGKDAAPSDEELGPPDRCLFCGSRRLKLRRTDRAGREHWFCPACEQKVVVVDGGIYQQSAG